MRQRAAFRRRSRDPATARPPAPTARVRRSASLPLALRLPVPMVLAKAKSWLQGRTDTPAERPPKDTSVLDCMPREPVRRAGGTAIIAAHAHPTDAAGRTGRADRRHPRHGATIFLPRGTHVCGRFP